jgi:hypothetical protein
MEKSSVVVRSDTHEVCLYEAMFRAGFRLPFISIVRDLLSFLDVSPHHLSPNSWRTFFNCCVLWPLALGKDHQLSANEFMHVYRIQRNPGSFGVYNFQTKRGKFVQLDSKYSSNWHQKNKYFFVSRQWEFAPKEKAQGPRVPRKVNTPADRAFQKPILTSE